MIEEKLKILNPKQYQMTENRNSKRYDLEERTLKFAAKVRDYIKKLPKNKTNAEIGDQLFRAAGSVGANYIEANEALGRKDFAMRIRICRKEAKESRYMKIFGSILEKCQ